MDYICKICNQKIESNGHFWENHRQKISDYFHQYEPRQTKDGKRLDFKKDIESYFEESFNSLSERNAWIKANPEIGKEFILDLLVRRKLKKAWKYAPSQTLLKLSGICSALYLEKQFNATYNDICEKLGFKIKFVNSQYDIDWNSELEVIQDTREQKELNWPKHIKTITTKLEYGDYAAVGSPEIAIERKSISDLAGTLSAGYDRFRRELERAGKDKGYLVILVESAWNDFKSIEYLPQTKHIKSTYDHLAKRARDLHEEFSNFQMVFTDGRKHAVKVAEFILKLGDKVKKTDLQLLVDKKII